MSKSLLLTAVAGAISLGVLSDAKADELPKSALVYKVIKRGLNQEEAGRLQKVFRLDALTRDDYGAVRFLDQKAFLFVPMQKITPSTKERPEDSEGPILYEGFDLEAISRIKVPDLKSATEKVEGLLREADLLPAGAIPLPSHTRLEVTSKEGRNVITKAIDTAVSFQFTLEDIPLEGPGAKIRVALGSRGEVIQLNYASRELEAIEKVRIVDKDEAAKRCATWTSSGKQEYVRDITTTLAYFAPQLSSGIDRLEPSIRCAAIDDNGVASQIYFVPASVDAMRSPLIAPQIRREIRQSRVKLKNILDYIINPADAAFGRRDVGSEGTGPCSGLPHTGLNINSFNNRMTASGVVVQFAWLDGNAWEDDWKDPSQSGDDSDWVDDVDMAYWQGHGWPEGFSFSGCSSNDDTSMTNADALWGNRNVEWVSLFTCLVLKGDSGGQSWSQRWGSAFDRLHQINSFDTVSYHSAQHGGIYAEYLLRNNPLNVRQAWAQASIDDQPPQVVWATMGAISANGLVNFNDFFWGKGSVGPDIPASQITGYWRISGGS